MKSAREQLDIVSAYRELGSYRATAAFTLFDELGSLVGLIGPDRTVTEATRFDGWGETVAHAGTTQSPWGFRGHLDISPSADPLYDMGARFYAPSLGAFTQLDTWAGSAANPASMNRFLYAEANPATLIDPTGHKTCTGYNDDDCDRLPSDKVAQEKVLKTWREAKDDPVVSSPTPAAPPTMLPPVFDATMPDGTTITMTCATANAGAGVSASYQVCEFTHDGTTYRLDTVGVGGGFVWGASISGGPAFTTTSNPRDLEGFFGAASAGGYVVIGVEINTAVGKASSGDPVWVVNPAVGVGGRGAAFGAQGTYSILSAVRPFDESIRTIVDKTNGEPLSWTDYALWNLLYPVP